jgi:3-hydroxymyristoyl/3-hydroxydecanoyl-(acyl carrier protein) dehydratase
MLPWRQPFQAFDRMIECVPHERILTMKRVTANDLMGASRAAGAVLPDDWEIGETKSGPDASGGSSVPPITGPETEFPDAMVIEGMSQSAALLFAMSYDTLARGAHPVLGDVKATRHSAAAPGETVRYSVRAVKMTSTAGLFEATAEADGRLIAEAGFAMSVAKTPDDADRGRT